MDFKDTLRDFTKRVETLKNSLQTEEATKMSLIVPFFQILGYDVFNPTEFCPEYTADVGIKKGEKVDYAILVNNKPVILIEAKSTNKSLDKYSSQLFRYFVTTPAKFAILTNGIIYRFYSDLEEQNKMDKEPFLEIDLLSLKDNQIPHIEKFKRDNLNINEILNSASLLKYNLLFKNQIEQQFGNPTDEFVKLFLQPIYKGTKTQAIIEKFRPILKKALDDYLSENLNEKLQYAINNTNTSAKTEERNLSTKNEWNAFSLLKELLKNTLDVNKISIKNTESYTAVLYENNVRKWICRFIFSSNQTILILPDENKKELRYSLSDIKELSNYTTQLIEVSNRYLYPVPSLPKDLLYTKWGTYEMPEPYHVCFTRGPRTDLKKISIK
ncbi:MAG: type I restriction endonuclease [bacterium]|nr:type I restriction endonuclease [bacterium]